MKHRYLLLTVAILLIFGMSARAGDILIRAGKVYTMTGPALEPGAVLVSDGKIVSVAKEIDAPQGAQVIDLKSGTLIPGLVDAYSQAGLTGEDDLTKEVSPSYRVLSAVDWESRDFREALDQGTTTLGLAPGTNAVISGLSCAVKTAKGPKADPVVKRDVGLFVTMASDPGSRNRSRTRPDSIFVRQPNTRMGVIWMVRSIFDRAKRGDNPDLAPVRQAVNGKLPLFAVSRTDHDLLALLRTAKEFNCSPIIVGGQEAYKVIDDIVAAKAPVILEPLTTGESGEENTDIIWNPAGALHQAGIPVALSGGNLLEQARFAVRFGLPREAALKAVTVTPARLLGLNQRLGALAPQFDADLVAFYGDPLELTSRIKWVMVDGTIHSTGE